MGIGTKPASLASIPTVQQRGPIAPAPVYDLTKKNVKYPDFDACAHAQKFDTYGCSPCPEPQEPTYVPVDEQHYGASFPAPEYGYHVDGGWSPDGVSELSSWEAVLEISGHG